MKVPELLDRNASVMPQADAFRDANRRVSTETAVHAVERIAERLRQAGVTPGQRVLIVSENDVATPLLLLAAQRIGAWPALANARVAPAELAAMRQCVSPRLTVYATDASPAAASLATPACVQWVDEHAGVLLVDASPDVGATAPAQPGDDIGLLLFTSGTTGQAKAVMWSHTGLVRLGRVLAQTRATKAGSVVQCAGPLSHIMGIANLMAALYVGATLQLMPRLEPHALVAAILAGEVTHLSLVPTAYQRLCDHLEARGLTLVDKGLRYISSGGAPLDEALKGRVERLFGLRLVNGYGMTECAPGSRTRPDTASPADCIGWPEPGVEMKIDVAAGESIGELLMKTSTKMLGYFGAPGETAAVIRDDGWVATGDLATQLPDGSFRLVGRRKEMIIRSGFNVYPAEVESALLSLPGVSQAAVVGLPTRDGNEEIVAFVRMQPDSASEFAALGERLATLLAPYKRPSRIESVDEFPLGPTGKIAKRVLRERLAAG